MSKPVPPGEYLPGVQHQRLAAGRVLLTRDQAVDRLAASPAPCCRRRSSLRRRQELQRRPTRACSRSPETGDRCRARTRAGRRGQTARRRRGSPCRLPCAPSSARPSCVGQNLSGSVPPSMSLPACTTPLPFDDQDEGRRARAVCALALRGMNTSSIGRPEREPPAPGQKRRRGRVLRRFRFRSMGRRLTKQSAVTMVSISSSNGALPARDSRVR